MTTETNAGFLEYELPDGWLVLVGRTGRGQRHRLSLDVAHPNDWCSVHGMPGSHVLLRARDDAEPDRRTLEQAAAIAAYYSKAPGRRYHRSLLHPGPGS